MKGFQIQYESEFLAKTSCERLMKTAFFPKCTCEFPFQPFCEASDFCIVGGTDNFSDIYEHSNQYPAPPFL